ncbi:hypothetical protein ACIBL3_44665 [Kribbella sp. NPDC050124]|uniref:hypothetical protein n=1 Tax=Kribbella sp. NPDC050124 TaxID=3364114 RepID=UPI00379E0E08
MIGHVALNVLTNYFNKAAGGSRLIPGCHRLTRRGRAMVYVEGLWRYPVKSLAGEALDAADSRWHRR